MSTENGYDLGGDDQLAEVAMTTGLIHESQNDAYWDALDNHSDQLNPNNDKYEGEDE